jgi:hypothetical protein
MPGYNRKEGHGLLPPIPIVKAISQNDPPPPKSQRPLAKAIPSLWVQLPDIETAKDLFVKDKLPDGLIFPLYQRPLV